MEKAALLKTIPCRLIYTVLPVIVTSLRWDVKWFEKWFCRADINPLSFFQSLSFSLSIYVRHPIMSDTCTKMASECLLIFTWPRDITILRLWKTLVWLILPLSWTLNKSLGTGLFFKTLLFLFVDAQIPIYLVLVVWSFKYLYRGKKLYLT